MELLLVLEIEGDSPGSGSVDVAVRLPADASVGGLQEALIELARRRGLLPPTGSTSLGLYRPGDRAALRSTTPVLDAGVADGDTLVLRPVGARGRWSTAAAADVPKTSGTVLDVIGGPDSGTSVALELGALTVGRSPRCRLVVRDPTLSRRHLSLQVGARWGGGLEVTVVPDASARNRVLIDGRLVEGPQAWEPGELLRAGDSVLVLRPSDWAPAVPPAPSAGPPRRDLGGVRSAPSMPVGGALAGRRFAQQRAAFYDEVERMAARVDEALREERAERHAAAPDVALLVRGVEHQPDRHDRHHRRPPGPGTAATAAAPGPRSLTPLRVGLREVPSLVTVGVAPGGAAELRRQARDRLAYHRTVRDVPLTVDLDEVGTLGVCDDEPQTVAATTALLLQAACLHPPRDLVVAAAIGEPHRATFEWLRWLPHLRAPSSPSSPLEGLKGAALAVGPDAAGDLVDRLLDVVAQRLPQGGLGPGGHWPRVLVAIDRDAEVPRWLLDRLLAVAVTYGIHVLWFGGVEPVVPARCGAVLRCAGSGKPASLRQGDREVVVEPDGVQPATARSIARRLASRWNVGRDRATAPGDPVVIEPLALD